MLGYVREPASRLAAWPLLNSYFGFKQHLRQVTMDQNVLQTVVKLLQNRSDAIITGLLALFTFGGHELFSVVVIECPCAPTQNLIYGLVVFTIPTFILFLLGLLLNNHMARLLTGCVRWRARLRLCSCLSICGEILGRSAIAPVTWLIAALIRGSYFQCAVAELQEPPPRLVRLLGNGSLLSPREVLSRLPCPDLMKDPSIAEEAVEFLREELMRRMDFQSQLVGWGLLAVSTSLFFLVNILAMCFSPISLLQLKYWKLYLKVERGFFDNAAQIHAQNSASRNIRRFFGSAAVPTDSNVPGNEGPPDSQSAPVADGDNRGQTFLNPTTRDWWSVSQPYTYHKKNMYYSELQRWAEYGLQPDTDKGSTPLVLDFVDFGRSATGTNLESTL
uniref:calcium homeostasis modulator protein 6-like isoform X1 n=2 Tax=Myxine glutinosa TaxID=7769 RepID=UPI00358E8D58